MKRLLDVGCGPGTITNVGYYESFKKRYIIYGIDILEKNIPIISRKYPDGIFKKGYAEKIPFKNNSFDFILARHVLEHVHSLNKALSEIQRVSKSKASLLIAVPHPSLEKILVKLIPYYLNSGHHHERVFAKDDLPRYLKKHTFKIIKSSNQKWPLFVATVLLALFSRIFGMSSMEEQTGTFRIFGKSYVTIVFTRPLFTLMFSLIQALNFALPFLNSLIPFEVEILARKVNND